MASIDGRLTWMALLPLPFVSAGLGYLRHLHESETLAEEGFLWHAGVGTNVARGAPRAGWPVVKYFGDCQNPPVRSCRRFVLCCRGAACCALFISAVGAVALHRLQTRAVEGNGPYQLRHL